MDPGLEARINVMFKRDVIVAVILATTMWATLIFVCYAALSVIDDVMVKVVLLVACAILGAFNTLGLLATIRRFKIERAHVYGEDIHHLDTNRRVQQERAVAPVSAS